jgi:hypothetical protein
VARQAKETAERCPVVQQSPGAREASVRETVSGASMRIESGDSEKECGFSIKEERE